jgi:myosin heavy subunit
LLAAASAAVGYVKQGCALYKEYKAAGAEVVDVMQDISKHLGKFFTAQETLVKVVKEEETKPKKKESSLNQQALDRVLAQRRMAQMEVELRETLIYQSPPELGAVYTDFLEMRKVIQQEQAQEEEEQKQRERLKSWQRRQMISDLQDKALYLVVVAIVILYLYLMFWLIVMDRRVRWGF